MMNFPGGHQQSFTPLTSRTSPAFEPEKVFVREGERLSGVCAVAVGVANPTNAVMVRIKEEIFTRQV